MAKVTLRCGVYTEGSVFSVDIELDADVEALQKKIAGILSTEKNPVPPRLLTLYLARKKGEGKPEWMKHDHNTESFLLGDVDSGYDKMLSSSFLDEDYFGSNFQPGRKEIHVLVKLRESKLPALPGDRQFVVGDVSIPVTIHAVLNPAPLVAFWKALVNDRTEVKAGALIKLPEGTYLLGDDSLGSRIYIRSCYPKLWKLCQQRIHDEVKKTPHLVILGNPGIGKTFFGFVILLLLAHAGATVVYENGILEKRFLFSRDVVAQGSQEDFAPILDRSTTYYIVDAVKPTYFKAKTILVTSPRRSIWYEFNKTNCQSCYMPVWSMKEILQCRELMYADTPVTVVQDCFRRWGGIARYVLRYAQVDNQQALLGTAIDSADLDLLVSACGQVEAKDAEVSHRLLHYRVNKNFDIEYFVFASQYVQQTVYRRLYQKDKRKLLEFIAASDGVGALAVLRGHLFEGHVHSVLPRGGVFPVRRLVDNDEGDDDGDDVVEDEWDGEDEDVEDDGDDDADEDEDVDNDEDVDMNADGSVISLNKSEQVVVFTQDSEVVAAANTSYLQPAAKNYQSVDAIIKPDILFQVTGAHKHPCKQKGLHTVLKLLGNPAVPRLYFVLPPDRFAKFKYQRYLNATRKRMTVPSYVNVRKIQQFAMEVPLELESTQQASSKPPEPGQLPDGSSSPAGARKRRAFEHR